MQFTVPQIEKEAKIFGPFSWKQSIYIFIAGIICFILYFSVPFSIFLLCSIFLLSGACALAFIKINGITLPKVIQNFFVFQTKSKIYLWKKKDIMPQLFKETKEIKKDEKEKQKSVLKIRRESSLTNLSSYLETQTK